MFDGTKVDGPVALRNWLVNGYTNAFVEVAAEKLLTYALGRGMEYKDMPLVRAVAREAGKSNYRFSALVLAVVKSDAFRMNMKVDETSAPKQACRGAIADISKIRNTAYRSERCLLRSDTFPAGRCSKVPALR